MQKEAGFFGWFVNWRVCMCGFSIFVVEYSLEYAIADSEWRTDVSQFSPCFDEVRSAVKCVPVKSPAGMSFVSSKRTSATYLIVLRRHATACF